LPLSETPRPQGLIFIESAPTAIKLQKCFLVNFFDQLLLIKKRRKTRIAGLYKD
jgi:hypothetical protein